MSLSRNDTAIISCDKSEQKNLVIGHHLEGPEFEHGKGPHGETS